MKNLVLLNFLGMLSLQLNNWSMLFQLIQKYEFLLMHITNRLI